MSESRRATATLVVQYQDSTDDAMIKAEICRERSGGTIYIGDDVFFRIYANCDYTINQSSGGISRQNANVSDLREELITFGGTETANLGYPYYGGDTVNWYGKSYDLQWPAHGRTNLVIPNITSDLQRWNIAGAAEVTYNSQYNLYRLTANERVVVIFILQTL